MHSDYDRRDSREYSSNRGGGRDRDRDRGGDRGGRRGVPLAELDPALTGTSHKVIGCARDVHMALGPGFDRTVYLHAIIDEMRTQGIDFKPDHAFDVRFKDKVVGKCVADLFIADRFIVQIMSRPGEIGSYERAALRAQLRAADLELGLIINFAGRLLKDGLVRVLNPDKLAALRGENADTGHDLDDGGSYDPDANN